MNEQDPTIKDLTSVLWAMHDQMRALQYAMLGLFGMFTALVLTMIFLR